MLSGSPLEHGIVDAGGGGIGGVSAVPSTGRAGSGCARPGHTVAAPSVEALPATESPAEHAAGAERQLRQNAEANRNSHGMVRIMGRVRPPLEGEEGDVGCLIVCSRHELQVLMEPRALLSEPLTCRRRRMTGSVSEGTRSKSSPAPLEAHGVQHSATTQSLLEPRSFVFDKLFDAKASDDDVFSTVHEELAAAVEGEAVCIIAYGATGSGKTHTIMSLADRAACDLERQAESLLWHGVQLEILVQNVEIYNEQLRDLLAEGRTDLSRLKLWASGCESMLRDASSWTVSAESEGGIAANLHQVFRLGQAQRVTSATAVHGRSSRSHLVTTLFLVSRSAADGAVRHVGKLSFVDLAGSERLKCSEAVGHQRRETLHINRSLSALADVISAKERRIAHVPYRNSKLTQLLQEELGRQQRCHVVVVVALSPTRRSLSNNLHSLQFSSRLKALSLPLVSSHGSLGSPKQDWLHRFPSTPLNSREHVQLKQEATRWRSEYERTLVQLGECRGALEAKDRQLRETVKQNAELKAAAWSFEQGRRQLFQGFLAFNRRLQDVEAATLEDSGLDVPPRADIANEVAVSALAAGTSSQQQWSPADAATCSSAPDCQSQPASQPSQAAGSGSHVWPLGVASPRQPVSPPTASSECPSVPLPGEGEGAPQEMLSFVHATLSDPPRRGPQVAEGVHPPSTPTPGLRMLIANMGSTGSRAPGAPGTGAKMRGPRRLGQADGTGSPWQGSQDAARHSLASERWESSSASSSSEPSLSGSSPSGSRTKHATHMMTSRMAAVPCHQVSSSPSLSAELADAADLSTSAGLSSPFPSELLTSSWRSSPLTRSTSSERHSSPAPCLLAGVPSVTLMFREERHEPRPAQDGVRCMRSPPDEVVSSACSFGRKALCTQFKHAVQVVSEARAQQLALNTSVRQAGAGVSSPCTQSPQSAALLLCTEAEESTDDGKGCIRSRGSEVSDSVSVSSDEGTIRDRLRQSLLSSAASPGAEPAVDHCERGASVPGGGGVPAPGRRPPASFRVGSPGQAARQASARPLCSPPPPRSTLQRPPAAAQPAWRAQLPKWMTPQSPRERRGEGRMAGPLAVARSTSRKTLAPPPALASHAVSARR